MVSAFTREETYSGSESEFDGALEKMHTRVAKHNNTYSSQEGHTLVDGYVVNQVGSDIKPHVKYDTSVDDVTDSSDFDESSPNEDSQDTEAIEGY